jgi:hypothetical protein
VLDATKRFKEGLAITTPISARVLHDQFAPKPPPSIAIAQLAQLFFDSTRRALSKLGDPGDIDAHLVRAIEHWQASTAIELKRLYREAAQ